MSDNPAMHREAFHLLTDKLIGRGVSREVWSSKVLPNCVIKVESSAQRFQNVIEWEVWHRVKSTKFAKWFAPCEWISPNGSILIMRKTEVPGKSEYPDKLPVFFSDIKFENFGLLNGEFMAHDYGINMLLEKGMSSKLRTVHWYGMNSGY